MATERPVNLSALRPGAAVAQPAKRVRETRWSEGCVTLVYEDGSTFSGALDDAVFVIAEPEPEPEPEGEGEEA